MHKKNLLSKIIVLLIALPLLAGCQNKTEDTRIESLMEHYSETQNMIDTESTVISIDQSADKIDNIKGLFSNAFITHNDRVYFKVSAENGGMVWMYITAKTGEIHTLCPDILCGHTYSDGCKYLDLGKLHPDEKNDDVMYSVKTYISSDGISDAVCRIDLANNKLEEIYRTDFVKQGIHQNDIEILMNFDNHLYFTETQYQIASVNDSAGDAIAVNYFYSMDLTTGEVSVLSDEYVTNNRCLFADSERIYFVDELTYTLYSVDHSFNNRKDILTYDANAQVYRAFYDENESAIYFLILSKALTYSNQIAEGIEGTGLIYRINRNGELEQIVMPTDTVTSFQLTEQYIYYTDFNPVFYGSTPEGKATVDEYGGKIFRVSRENTEQSEVVFDGKEEIFLYDSYTVIGNTLFMNYLELLDVGGFKLFKLEDGVLTINLSDQTRKEIMLP